MEQAAPSTSSRPGVLLAVLALGGGAYAMLQSLVLPALPTLQHDLHTTPTGVTWIFTAYLLAASVATPIAGRLGDMFGKKRTLVVVLAGLAGGTLLAALATTLPVLIGARAIQGLGGAIFPLAFGIVRDELPRERVAGGIALISGLLGVGGGLGIILAGPILAHLEYHWLFWIPFAVIVLTVLATMLIVPESPIRAPGNVNWAGATLLSLWLICLLVSISEAPTWGWLAARTLGLLGAAAALAVAWIRAETGSRSPLVDMRMMRLRGVWTTNLAGLLLGFGMYSAFVLIPQFVQTPTSNGYGFGSSVTQAGLFLIPSTTAMMIASPLGGRLSGRFGSKVPLVLGATITMLAFVLLAVAHSAHWQIYLASLLLGTGIGFAFASMSNLIVEAVRPDQTGVATGMNTVMRTVGGAVGGQVAASILAASLLASGMPKQQGYTLSFIVMAIALGAGVVASIAVPGREPHGAHVVAIAEPQPSINRVRT
jgi:EmrB/QacA subfamily drug resistance transporter